MTDFTLEPGDTSIINEVHPHSPSSPSIGNDSPLLPALGGSPSLPSLPPPHVETDLHKAIDNKIHQWLEGISKSMGVYSKFINPSMLLKSLIVATAISVMLWIFPFPMTSFYIPFLVVYFSYVLDKRAVDKFKSWKKHKDPSNLKIKDKIHFYESFTELELPPKTRKVLLSFILCCCCNIHMLIVYSFVCFFVLFCLFVSCRV